MNRAGREALRNGADPNEFITNKEINEFISLAGDAWDNMVNITIENLNVTSVPFSVFEPSMRTSIKTSSEVYRQTLAELVLKAVQLNNREPVFGEFVPEQLVQGGDVRDVLTSLGGGSAYPETTTGTGISLGLIFLDWLSANGYTGQEKIWLYGPRNRRTFDGHLGLDGLRFVSWQDDRLIVRPEDAWLKTPFYTPSDHFGCRCVVSLFVSTV